MWSKIAYIISLIIAIWIIICTGVVSGRLPQKTKTLYIGGIFPMSGAWAGGLGCRPAVDMAFEDINSRLDILPGYHLEMVSNDSHCMPGLGMNVMYELLYNPPTKVMLLGPGCSVVSTFVGQAARMWNLVVLSYGSSSPALSNRQRFPTFFRTHPSANLHNPTRIKLFQRYGWTRIATIQETQELFTSTFEDLEERVKDAGIEIAVRTSFLTNPRNAIKNLKRQDARIIVGLFYENMARRVFCEVYKQGLFGPKRVWFIIGWYADNWYEVKDRNVNCTAEQMKEALEGHYTTEGLMLYNKRDRLPLSNRTAEEFMSTVQSRLGDGEANPLSVTGYVEAPLAYDAVWALALALNKTQKKLEKENKRLEDFDYSRKDIMDEIYSAMNSTNFLGVSGRVLFDADGSRIALTQIEQMKNGNYNKLGYYDSLTAEFIDMSNDEYWPGGGIPQDRTIIVEELRLVSLGLFLAMSLLAFIGIILGTVLFIFNMRHRKRRYIALSQPHVNSLMLVGCMMCLSCVVLDGLDARVLQPEGFVIVCQARTVVLTIGFTFAYGPMFAKVWTIYRLTTRRKKEIKPFKEWEMYVVVVIFLILDSGILTALQVLDPLYRDLESFPHERPHDTDRDIEIKPLLEHCSAKHVKIWLGVLFGYKGVLLLFGLLLAYETRNMKVKQINDCRFVGMSIYNVVVLCLITAPVTLIISGHQDASYAFVAVAILLSCFLAMGLIFVPKIMEVRHNRDYNQASMCDSMHAREDEDRYQQLQLENDDIKKQITEKEDKILALKRRLDQRTISSTSMQPHHTQVTFHTNSNNITTHCHPQQPESNTSSNILTNSTGFTSSCAANNNTKPGDLTPVPSHYVADYPNQDPPPYHKLQQQNNQQRTGILKKSSPNIVSKFCGSGTRGITANNTNSTKQYVSNTNKLKLVPDMIPGGSDTHHQADCSCNVGGAGAIQLTVMNANYRPHSPSDPDRRYSHDRNTCSNNNEGGRNSYPGGVEASVDSGLPSSMYSSSLAVRNSHAGEEGYSEGYC